MHLYLQDINNGISATSFYPSPLELEQLQDNYASALTSRPSPSPDGDVPPFPTPDKKCDVYKQSDVDNYIEQSCVSILNSYLLKVLFRCVSK